MSGQLMSIRAREQRCGGLAVDSEGRYHEEKEKGEKNALKNENSITKRFLQSLHCSELCTTCLKTAQV
jgi:hypothetical protein